MSTFSLLGLEIEQFPASWTPAEFKRFSNFLDWMLGEMRAGHLSLYDARNTLEQFVEDKGEAEARELHKQWEQIPHIERVASELDQWLCEQIFDHAIIPLTGHFEDDELYFSWDEQRSTAMSPHEREVRGLCKQALAEDENLAWPYLAMYAVHLSQAPDQDITLHQNLQEQAYNRGATTNQIALLYELFRWAKNRDKIYARYRNDKPAIRAEILAILKGKA